MLSGTEPHCPSLPGSAEEGVRHAPSSLDAAKMAATTTASEAQQLQENWSNIISQKKDEINRLRERHVADLEERLMTKETEVVDLEDSFSKLKEDFKYNLEVLEERDRDLREYDEVLSREAKKGQDRSKVIDEMRGVVDKLQFELQGERQTRAEEQSFYKQKMYELKEEAQNAKYGREEAVLRQKERFESLRRGLEKEIEELKSERDLQNHHLRNEYGGKVQRLESELRLVNQESAHRIKQLEDKLESAIADLERTSASEKEKAESLSRALETSAEHERVNRAVSFEFEEWKASKEKAIADLEAKLQSATRTHQLHLNSSKTAENKLSLEVLELQTAMEQMQDTYQKRLEQEYSGLISERDTFKFRTEAAEERLKAVETELQSAQSAHKIEERELRERSTKLEGEKNQALQMLSSTSKEIASKYHAEIRLLKEELWSKNEEISILRTKESNMKSSLDDRRGDINSYKEQLASSLERERELKRSVRALELKAELDLQANEAKVSATNENVVKQLTQDKDYSSEKLRQYEEKIMQQEDEIASLRDKLEAQASQTQPQPQPQPQVQPGPAAPETWSPDSSLLGLNLALSDISPAVSLNTPGKPDPIISKLKEMEMENARLKDVIGALRQEMESVQSAPVQDEAKMAALERELRASDADYQQAMDHVRILQSRDAGGDSSARSGAELDFLRTQSAKILQENRSMRRLRIHSGASDPPMVADHRQFQQPHDGAYDQERLLLYAKLVDMWNDLGPETRHSPASAHPTTSEDPSLVVTLAEEVSDLVRRACKRLEIKTKNLKRVTSERDRILELNNALRSSMDKQGGLHQDSKDGAGEGSGLGMIPSLPDYNTTERLVETNKKLSYVQNSLVDLKQQSEELMGYQKETQKLISQTEEAPAGGPPSSTSSSSKATRPRSALASSKAKAKAAQSSGGPSQSSARERQPSRQGQTSSVSAVKGLKVTGARAPASAGPAAAASSRNPAMSQGTASQRARLQALAAKRQKKEAQQKPQIRNYNIKDDDKAAATTTSAGGASKGSSGDA